MKPGAKRKISTPSTSQQNVKRKKLEASNTATSKKAEAGPKTKTSPRKNVAKPESKVTTKTPAGRSGKITTEIKKL